MTLYYPRPDCQIRTLAAIYDEHFGTKTDGYFVEVGAYDGRSFSITAFWADLGWRGLYIEAVPEFAARCVTNHGSANVTVLNVAIGAKEGEAEITIGGPLSTGLASQVAAYQTIKWAKNEFIVPRTVRVRTCTLDTALMDVGILPSIDLLVVDVEGMEDEVFAGFNLTKWNPQVAIVELEDEHPDFCENPIIVDRCVALRRLSAVSGYREVFRDCVNTVFVRA